MKIAFPPLRRAGRALLVAAATSLFVASCASMVDSAVLGAFEKVGYAKREVLVDRVEAAAETQQETKEQFQTALEEFRSIVDFDGGDLEAKYKKLNREYERAEAQADEVRDRNDAIESVAGRMFREWEGELDVFTPGSFERRESEAMLRDTRRQYDHLISVLRATEGRIDPVLQEFRSKVYFLKHSLNARAIASLRGESERVNVQVDNLIRDMERAIAEAEHFIQSMGGS